MPLHAQATRQTPHAFGLPLDVSICDSITDRANNTITRQVGAEKGVTPGMLSLSGSPIPFPSVPGIKPPSLQSTMGSSTEVGCAPVSALACADAPAPVASAEACAAASVSISSGFASALASAFFSSCTGSAHGGFPILCMPHT